jgi:RNA polymerase sigma-70 factor (ECF subfamily)
MVSWVERSMPEDQTAWVEQLRAKDEEAVRELVRSYAGPLARFLAGMTGSAVEAEDLAQEALIRLLEHAGEFRGESSLKTYLFRIAHNLALNYLASAPRRHEVFPEEMPDRPSAAPAPVQQMEASEDAGRIRSALAHLPPQQRAVVILRAWQDLSFKEIASTLSVAEGTAKAHYFFALKNMRRLMEATP